MPQLKIVILAAMIVAYGVKTSVAAQGQSLNDSFGSAATGYDVSTMNTNPVNPDSQQAPPYVQSEGNYQGFHHSATPQSAYTANTPGQPVNITPGPGNNLPAQFTSPSSLAGTSQSSLVPFNPQLLKVKGTTNGLPPTTLDSFVHEAGGNKELIYGDEGTTDIPPYNGFDKSHRIIAGIHGSRSKTLTTGHGSKLPDAWGGDEWHGNEWSKSGPSYASFPGSVLHVPAN